MKLNNWAFQWRTYSSDRGIIEDDRRLFQDWIAPVTLDAFNGATVLDCGCGRGQHLRFILDRVHSAVGVDLNTAEVARAYLSDPKVSFLEGDIASMDLKRRFNIVYSIGVLHHTDDPGRSFANIKRHVLPGGRLIVWVYSREGNDLNRLLVEPLTRHVFSRMDRRALLALSLLMTAALYLPVWTIYLLPLRFLPFYEYFRNFRRLRLRKNLQNVFDKVNAPQTQFIPRTTLKEWFNERDFSDVSITPYAGVSWRASGILRTEAAQ